MSIDHDDPKLRRVPEVGGVMEVAKPRRLQPCGTEAAFRRHRRRRDPRCQECLDAHNAYERGRYHDRKVVPAA